MLIKGIEKMEIKTYRTLLSEERQCILVKEKSRIYENVKDGILNEDRKIVEMLCNVYQLDRLPEEYVYLLCFNTKCKLLGVFELTHGTVCGSLISNREIFQKALLINASMIIIAHNHPSGDATPSQDDLKAYTSIERAGKLMQVPLLDSLIIGSGNFYSFKSEMLKTCAF